MLTFLGKKRISEDKIANVFINSLLEVTEDGFSEVVGLIRSCPEFERVPNINEADVDPFILTVITGNLSNVGSYFDGEQEQRLFVALVEKLANVYGVTTEEFYRTYKKHKEYISRVNHPSKNTLYGMSKAVFYQYKLGQYQDEYFRDMNTPNPMFLKKLNEAMTCFLWDWDAYLEKFKLTA